MHIGQRVGNNQAIKCGGIFHDSRTPAAVVVFLVNHIPELPTGNQSHEHMNGGLIVIGGHEINDSSVMHGLNNLNLLSNCPCCIVTNAIQFKL
jgi:hypothetical protein